MNQKASILERVKAKLRSLERQAWKPIMQPGDGSIAASKTSGQAWLQPGEAWTLCPNCQSPLRLVLQLNLQHLPGELRTQFGLGLLQLFCCESDFEIHTGTFYSTTSATASRTILLVSDQNEAGEMMDESSWLPEQTAEPVLKELALPCCLGACEPFSSSQVTRVVQPQGIPADSPMPTMEEFFPPKLITGWQETLEYPNPEEARAWGVVLDSDETTGLEEADLSARIGDKLGGWPCWAQALEYPRCPTCEQPMTQLIFQLEQQESENFPYPHQGLGVGYLVQCPTHLDQVTFFCQFT